MTAHPSCLTRRKLREPLEAYSRTRSSARCGVVATRGCASSPRGSGGGHCFGRSAGLRSPVAALGPAGLPVVREPGPPASDVFAYCGARQPSATRAAHCRRQGGAAPGQSVRVVPGSLNSERATSQPENGVLVSGNGLGAAIQSQRRDQDSRAARTRCGGRSPERVRPAPRCRPPQLDGARWSAAAHSFKSHDAAGEPPADRQGGPVVARVAVVVLDERRRVGVSQLPISAYTEEGSVQRQETPVRVVDLGSGAVGVELNREEAFALSAAFVGEPPSATAFSTRPASSRGASAGSTPRAARRRPEGGTRRWRGRRPRPPAG